MYCAIHNVQHCCIQCTVILIPDTNLKNVHDSMQWLDFIPSVRGKSQPIIMDCIIFL